ncbi:MAG: hypothetical protein V4599_11005 [Verrucomicrobiota bacterium]
MKETSAFQSESGALSDLAMKALLLLMILASQTVSCFPRDSARQKPQPLKIEKVSSQRLDSLVEDVVKSGLKQDSQLSDEARVESFDQFYDLTVKAIQPYGSFSDGGLEDADFTSSRYVDPCRKITISTSISIDDKICQSIITQLTILKGERVVVFDGLNGQTAIFASGLIVKE